jgi:glycosyltransferase involved in cell wall biosynthesis
METKTRPFFSVCVPAYNRKEFLPALLDSILSQDFKSFNVVIAEDFSPQREDISRIVEDYRRRFPDKIFLYMNTDNLGYDGNVRNLIDKANGHYCFFMGNDDLMVQGALSKVFEGISKHPNVGAVMRTYASFDGDPANVAQIFRYFPEDRFFEAGQNSAVIFYRRMVVIPGVVLHRDKCQALATSHYDGTLLYQLHLVGNLLYEMNGIFLSDVTVLYRNGGIPDFGASKTEKGKYTPGMQTPQSSAVFIRDLLRIAMDISKKRNDDFFIKVESDLAAYSYPLLSIQARQSRSVFFSYYKEIAKLGFAKYMLFHIYFMALFVLGPSIVDKIVGHLKSLIGHTPRLGSVMRRI